jgi:hypothetical protein
MEIPPFGEGGISSKGAMQAAFLYRAEIAKERFSQSKLAKELSQGEAI